MQVKTKTTAALSPRPGPGIIFIPKNLVGSFAYP
jgi:hypothetical protein